MKVGSIVKVAPGANIQPGNYEILGIRSNDYAQLMGKCTCCADPITDVYSVHFGQLTPTTEPASMLQAFSAGQRSDGYYFICYLNNGIHIMAGCRRFTSFTEAREHWTRTRAGTPLGDESFALLDKLEAEARKRGWLPATA